MQNTLELENKVEEATAKSKKMRIEVEEIQQKVSKIQKDVD